MVRITSFFLISVLLFLQITFLSSCQFKDNSSSDEAEKEELTQEENNEDKNDSPEENGSDSKDTVIVLPPYKDYGRNTIDFDKIVYKRPDFDAVIASIEQVTQVIKVNEIPFEEQISMIKLLEGDYNNLITMYSYANIQNSLNAADKSWADEYAFVSVNYPSFTKATEDMFVAAAASENALRFEEEYFGEGLIEKYGDGGIYTDELIILFQRESELASEYNSLSTSNVKITYLNVTDTYDNIVKYYRNTYGESSVTFAMALAECDRLYAQKYKETALEIFVSLLKVRRDISDELGHESYQTFAYETMGHEYTQEEMHSFIADIKTYIIPAYITMYNFIFYPFFAKYESKTNLEKNDLINNFYSVCKDMDTDLGEVFAYMLQHGLYSIENAKENRFEGSFATYLNSYKAPYLFVTTQNGISDYLTLAHEFGHFYDSYVNMGSDPSLDLSEISSTAFEWLFLDKISEKLSVNERKYLTYKKYSESMETFINQGFFALFEHYAYELPKDNISKYTIELVVDRAANALGLNPDSLDATDVIIPHIILYPFYVQSYCVSESISIGIYFASTDHANNLKTYKTLIDRTDGNPSFSQQLDKAKIESPFKAGYLKDIANSIYYRLTGSYYYDDHYSPGISA